MVNLLMMVNLVTLIKLIKFYCVRVSISDINTDNMVTQNESNPISLINFRVSTFVKIVRLIGRNLPSVLYSCVTKGLLKFIRLSSIFTAEKDSSARSKGMTLAYTIGSRQKSSEIKPPLFFA